MFETNKTTVENKSKRKDVRLIELKKGNKTEFLG